MITKSILGLFCVCAIAVVVFWSGVLTDKKLDEASLGKTIELLPGTTTDDSLKSDQPDDTEEPPEGSRSVEELVVNEALFQNLEDEMSELIDEFNQNLDNPERRAELEQRLSRLSIEYKQQVLAKVKNSQR